MKHALLLFGCLTAHSFACHTAFAESPSQVVQDDHGGFLYLETDPDSGLITGGVISNRPPKRMIRHEDGTRTLVFPLQLGDMSLRAPTQLQVYEYKREGKMAMTQHPLP